jgi:23S rRNA pseudouridine955/2504/2580 synthase
MSQVAIRAVTDNEDELRLDRWFRLNYPGLGHGHLQKLLRTGQVRVDGKRVKPGFRLKAGQQVRVPPLSLDRPAPRPRTRSMSAEDEQFVQSLVLFRDDAVIALNKPAGLAVQGGSGLHRHLDGMLDGLRFDYAEAPRLVHRLDKDTSGVLLLGRTRAATATLGKAFRGRTARKLYWAITVGVPKPPAGRIDLPLAKLSGPSGERVVVDRKNGRRALTWYRVIETAAQRLAWVALWPRTGRTHQLRVHCAESGWPILGDGKYGGPAAFLSGEAISRKVHLHAREIVLPHPTARGEIVVRAPLPNHMKKTWGLFDFDEDREDDPFGDDFRQA